MITLGTTSFRAGRINETTITIPAGIVGAIIGTEMTGLRFSKDGTSFSTSLTYTEGGTFPIYVRCGNIPGTYYRAIEWQTFITVEPEEGTIDITITGGTAPKFEQINFAFQPREATVQYNGNIINTPMAVGRNLSGTVLDHAYQFEVERVAEQGSKAVINGAAFATALVQKLIVYQVQYDWNWALLGWERPSFQDHLSAISSEIGIPITLVGADFYPKTDQNLMLHKGFGRLFEQLSGSFGEIMQRLIGWSDTVPGKAYHLYINNGSILIVQQGYERNTHTPTNWALRPTLTHSIRHTQWADSQYQTLIPKEISSSDAANSNEPYNGTITWGTTTLTYVDGYLTQETRGNLTTTYTYADATGGGKRLTQKETVDTDENTYSITTYTYQSTGVEEYLFEEKTENYDGQDDTGTLISSMLTRHVPIGGGWYGSTTYDTSDGNEEEISTNLSQGAPGNKASQYTIDAQNDALKPSNGQTGRQMTVPLNGVAKARQSYPVADYNTLSAIAGALDSYEGKEEIQLTGEIVGGSHIYTYDDIIVFEGNSYYLISNTVTQTYNKIRQNITAVRWL